MNRFFENTSGATAIEYALIASLIGFVIIGAWTAIGTDLAGIFATLAAVF